MRLHDGKLIKDRRYHLRTYPNCFVAQELIDWLVSHKEVSDRATAVCLMQHLMDNDIVHHGERCRSWTLYCWYPCQPYNPNSGPVNHVRDLKGNYYIFPRPRVSSYSTIQLLCYPQFCTNAVYVKHHLKEIRLEIRPLSL